MAAAPGPIGKFGGWRDIRCSLTIQPEGMAHVRVGSLSVYPLERGVTCRLVICVDYDEAGNPTS